MPWKGPRYSPRVISCSAWRAAARSSAGGARVVKALSSGLSVAMRARTASRSSTGDSARRRMRSPASASESWTSALSATGADSSPVAVRGASRSGRCSSPPLTHLEPRVDDLPVDVREEGVDVLRALRRLVVEQEGVLPDVHHEDRDEARDVADLVERDPVVRQPSGPRVLEADRPSDAAHLPDPDEVRLPELVAAEAVLGGPTELGAARRVA